MKTPHAPLCEIQSTRTVLLDTSIEDAVCLYSTVRVTEDSVDKSMKHLSRETPAMYLKVSVWGKLMLID